MLKWLLLPLLLGGLSGCAGAPSQWAYLPGANHSLATSDCTNGDPDLRQAMLGCPN